MIINKKLGCVDFLLWLKRLVRLSKTIWIRFVASCPVVIQKVLVHGIDICKQRIMARRYYKPDQCMNTSVDATINHDYTLILYWHHFIRNKKATIFSLVKQMNIRRKYRLARTKPIQHLGNGWSMVWGMYKIPLPHTWIWQELMLRIKLRCLILPWMCSIAEWCLVEVALCFDSSLFLFSTWNG